MHESSCEKFNQSSNLSNEKKIHCLIYPLDEHKMTVLTDRLFHSYTKTSSFHSMYFDVTLLLFVFFQFFT